MKDLEGSEWKSRISEPKLKGINRWKGDDEAKRAFYNNRACLLSEVARQAIKLCAELVERSFVLALDRGGMCRIWLHGQGNVQKRYLIHISGYNLSLIMRLLTSSGTPRCFADADIAIIWLRYPLDDQTVGLLGCLVAIEGPHRGTVLGSELVLFDI